MPLIFSYGSLQEENVQLSTFGRRLDGWRDELVGFEQSSVPIEDPQIAAAIGKTHHANVAFNASGASRVPGTVFEITDAELASVDAYEAGFSYRRIAAPLASGRQAWVYVHAPGQPQEQVMDTLELDRQLNTLIIQGKSGEAFQKFYAEDVVAQENDEPERVGRDTWMRARQELEKRIKKYHARVLAHAANGDTSFSEWEYDMELEGMGPMKVVQVAVRRWKDEHVVRERFYHK